MSIFRRNKLLVCVSEQHATAAFWQGGTIEKLQCFARSEQGLAEFREFLAPHAGTPVSIIVDGTEEDYRVESLPHSRGRERKQMLARKLKQHYRNTAYTGAWLQGRESGDRRDDRVLFAALNNPELVSDWLRVVHAQGLPLSGIHMLPMVMAGIADRLRVRTRNLAILAHNHGRLRVTYFREGQLRLSRVTATDGDTAPDLARVFAGEISNTRLYLHALRTATLDERLTVLLLDARDSLEAVFATMVLDNPALRCLRVSAAELGTKLRMRSQDLVASPDSLYLQLFALTSPAGNIAPPSATEVYRRYRTRNALYAVCGGVVSLAAVCAAVNGWLAYGIHSNVRAVNAQIGAQQARYEQITRGSPDASPSGDAMKRTVDVAQLLREKARDPAAVMSALSQALESSPEIIVRELGWSHAPRQIQKTSDSGAIEPAAQAGTTTAARKQSAYLVGEIRPFRGDYRAAISSIDGLLQRLRRLPQVAEVRIVRMPLNISPSATLSGTTLDRHEERTTAEFELVVVYQPRV